MNCQNLAEVVSELARGRHADQIEANVHERALAHLDECAECELKLQDERALTRRLQEMAREMRAMTAPAGIEAQLLTTFRQARQRSEVREQRSEIGGRRSEIKSRWSRRVVAAAAVVLLVFGVAGLRRYIGRQEQPVTDRLEKTVADAPKPSPSTAEVLPTSSPVKLEKQIPERVVRRANPRRPVRSLNRDSVAQTVAPATRATAKDSESEVATQFMPIGFAGPINPQDGGQLVRVELPRTAMLSMGLPVNMDRYGERVKADVLLGADGLARAIRFVQ
jgi:hypothetical protein